MAFCTAAAYDFNSLQTLLTQNFTLMPYITDDVYHIRLTSPSNLYPNNTPSSSSLSSSSSSSSSPSSSVSFSNIKSADKPSKDISSNDPSDIDDIYADAEAFVFLNGCVVTWGASDIQNDALLKVVAEVEQGRYDSTEVEWFHFVVDTNEFVYHFIMNFFLFFFFF